jgi:hypothetical protein
MKREPCGLYAAPNATDRHIYCGPTAMAAITGFRPVAVEFALQIVRKTQPKPRRERHARGDMVRAMWSSEVEPLARALGWRADSGSLADYGLTLAQWQRRRVKDPAPYLVLVTGHFVAVQGRWFVDSAQREPIPFSKAKHKRKRVVRVWRLEEVK